MTETVVQDDCSRLGLRRLHVMRMGAPVEVDPWLEKRVPAAARETAILLRRQEETLGVHHLYLFWKAREVLRAGCPQRPVELVVWWVGKSGTLRQAAGEAACEYEMRAGCWPDTVWVKALPKGAPERFGIYDGQELRLQQADWALPGFIIVGREAELEEAR